MDIIKDILIAHKDIFEHDISHYISIGYGRFENDPDNDSYCLVSIPDGATKHETKGLILKDDMGLITLQYRFKKINERHVEEVGHTYRYIDSNHMIAMTHILEGSEKTEWGPCPFSFRYDLDFTNNAEEDPPMHLQMAHNAPRFITGNVILADFLNTVRATCFKNGTPLLANKDPFFSNRR